MVDPDGRIFGAGEKHVWRLDPGATAPVALAGPGTGLLAAEGVDDGLDYVCSPVLAPNGDLVFVDEGNLNVKRIPKDKLK